MTLLYLMESRTLPSQQNLLEKVIKSYSYILALTFSRNPTGKTTLILKPGIPPDSASYNQPISLLCCLSKIVEIFIYSHEHTINGKKIIPDIPPINPPVNTPIN